MPNFIILHAEELRLPLSMTVLAMSLAFCYMLYVVTDARIPRPANNERSARARTAYEDGPPARRTEDTQISTDSTDSTDSAPPRRQIRNTVSTHLRQPFAGAKPLARKCSTTLVSNMNKIRPRSQSFSNVMSPALGILKAGKKDRLNNARACSPVHSDLHTLVEATSDDPEGTSSPPAERAQRPQPSRARTHGSMQRPLPQASTSRPRHLSVTKQPEPRTSSRLRTMSLLVLKRNSPVSEEPIRSARPACPENSLPKTVFVKRYESPFRNIQRGAPAASKVNTPIAQGEPTKRKSKMRRMLSAVVPFGPSKATDHTLRNTAFDEYDSVSPRSSISSQATSTTSTSTTPCRRRAASTAAFSMSINENESTDSSRRGSDATTRSFCVHDGVPCTHPYGEPYFECPPKCQHRCKAKQRLRQSSTSAAMATSAGASQ